MKSNLRVISLVFHKGLRAAAKKAEKIGVRELRYRENKNGTVTARFIMPTAVIGRFVEAMDEYGFEPDEMLRNFGQYRTSSDASVQEEDLDVGGEEENQDVDLDGVSEEEGEPDEGEGWQEPEEDNLEEDADGNGELLGNEDEGGAVDQTELGDDIDQGVHADTRVGSSFGDPFEGKVGGAFGEADESLPNLSPKLGVQGNSLAVDTRPKKIAQAPIEGGEGVGGEISQAVKAILSKEGIVAPRSFKIPGYRVRVEGGKDRIRVIPKKAQR